MTNCLELQRTRKPIMYSEEILGRKKGLSGHLTDCYIDLSSASNYLLRSAPGGVRIGPVVAHALLTAFRNIASHCGQSLQGIIGLLLFSVLGAVGDLGLIGEVFHPLLREG